MKEITIGEENLYRQSFEYNQRLDGRQNDEFREMFINKDYINYADGSAVLQIQGENMLIISGIKLDLIDGGSDDYFNLTVMCNSQDQKNKEQLEQQIINNYLQIVIQQLKQQLVIIKDKKHWKLFIDVYIVGEQLHLYQMEHICECILLCLESLKIPKLKANINELTDELEFELESINGYHKLDLSKIEDLILIQIGEYNDKYVIDMNCKEFMSCSNIFNVLLDVKSNIVLRLNNINTSIFNINSIIQLQRIALKYAKDKRQFFINYYQSL